jgi:hypothetical protein
MELGFHLHLDPTDPLGFDVERTLPSRYWFGEKLRTLDRGLLTDLLASTVHALQCEIPGLGEVVSFDVKHIYAWVQENNERVSVKDRCDKTRRLAGDPDCRFGVKRRTNKELPDGTTEEKVEALWGYGSGVAAATTPDYGDVVLAEYTQPFNQGDVTYFRPLHQQASLALGPYPTHLAADAAYDAQVASMTPWLVMAALLPFPSMRIVKPSSTLMASRFALSACAWFPPFTTPTPTATVLCVTAVPSFSPKQPDKPVCMNSFRKAKDARKRSTMNLGVALASSWTVILRSTTLSTTSAPLASASIARRKHWGLSVLAFAMDILWPT